MRRSPTTILAAGLALCLAAGVAAPAVARAQEPDGGAQQAPEEPAEGEPVDEVDQQLRILERRLEVDSATVGAGKDGFFIRSADGAFQLRLRGLVQFDGRFWGDDVEKPQTDTFTMRRVRPIVEATVFRIYDLRIVPDFGEGRTVLQDAYLEARFHAAAKVRAGKFKTPFGLERLQSASDILFAERALPTNLVPNRDLGVQVSGEILDGAFSYAAGVFNGVPDGSSADADTNDGKDLAARVFVQPFKKTTAAGLRGLGLGVAATRGTNRGTPAATGLAGFRTPAQATFFGYLAGSPPSSADTVVADGRRFRVSPQLHYSAGRFGLLGEYVRASHEVRLDAGEATLKHVSWQATASLMLTKDKASYRGVSPSRPFGAGVEGRGPGAVEVVARAAGLRVDEDAFPLFAGPTASARAAAERGIGVNWYLDRNLKAVLDYVETTFEGGGGAPGVDREDERVLLGRLQLAF